MATIRSIWLRPSSRTPVRSVERALAVAGQGLEGDHSGGGKRQITLIDVESWADACRELGIDVAPSSRRANLLVDGLRLGPTIGSVLTVGPCRIEVVGETAPCELLDDAQLGLMKALKPECRAGVYGRIVEGGWVALEDAVRLT